LKALRTKAEVTRPGPPATDGPAGRVSWLREPQRDHGGTQVLFFHTIMIAHIVSVAPDSLGVVPAQRTYGLWWQRLAAMCCAVAPPRGKDAGNFRGRRARGPAAPGSPGSGWRDASGSPVNGSDSSSSSPKFPSSLPGAASRALFRGFSPTGPGSPEWAQQRNIRPNHLYDKNVGCCAGVLRPTVWRNTPGAARAPVPAAPEREPAGEARPQPAARAGGAIDGPGRVGRAGHPLVAAAPAADRVRRRGAVIAERIDAGAGREVSAAGDGRGLVARPDIRRGRARSPPGRGRAAARTGTRARTTGQVVPGADRFDHDPDSIETSTRRSHVPQ
jgi:hypothetical protein